jgi:hypothetical protein
LFPATLGKGQWRINLSFANSIVFATNSHIQTAFASQNPHEWTLGQFNALILCESNLDLNMSLRNTYIAAFLGLFVIGGTLALWGQPLICTCGNIKFWVGSIFDGGNSQHIADWYSLSHILHGVLIAIIGRIFFPNLAFSTLLLVAVATGVGWELIEHTNWVLDKFRDTTINAGYHGDSVLNAVADYVWMLGGFFLAYNLRKRVVLAMVAALELSAAFIARDSLTLSTLMLVYPIDAVDTWQQEINPNA